MGLAPKQEKPAVSRTVAAIDWHVIEPYKEFQACGLKITPVHVDHGADYSYMFAFEFGKPPNRFVYMSDVTKIPDQCWEFLTRGGDRIETFVLDSLFTEMEHNTHLNL